MAENEKKTVNLTTPILVVLLTIASFLAGMFWTRLRGEELVKLPDGQVEKEAAQEVVAPPEVEPEAVLGEDDRAEIEKGGAAVKGEKGAPVTIVEFSEYECPFCKRYVDETYSQIWDEYGDQIYYVFHDYPLPFHPHAQQTAEAARCAGDQEGYWEMHDLLFANRDKWAAESKIDETLSSYAAELNLDTAEFDTCLSSGKHTQAVKDDFELGKKVGVSGTPSFFINGQMLVGAQPFSAFKSLIDVELGQ